MEAITLKLSNEAAYDELVQDSLQQAGGITIATKDRGTDQGNPVAVIAFDLQLPDGTIRRAQATTTVRLLQMALGGLRGRHGDV